MTASALEELHVLTKYQETMKIRNQCAASGWDLKEGFGWRHRTCIGHVLVGGAASDCSWRVSVIIWSYSRHPCITSMKLIRVLQLLIKAFKSYHDVPVIWEPLMWKVVQVFATSGQSVQKLSWYSGNDRFTFGDPNLMLRFVYVFPSSVQSFQKFSESSTNCWFTVGST